MMMNVIVGVAEMQVTNDRGKTLITYSLGSCIGITLYDPAARVGGLLHYMLPDSNIDSEKAKKRPGMFADTGIPLFFEEAYKLGAEKRRMQIKLAGGSQGMEGSGYFNIGRKNYFALRKILWINNVSIAAEDVGGDVNRTLSIEISSGRVWVRRSGIGVTEL